MRVYVWGTCIFQGSLLEMWVPLQVWELLTVTVTKPGLPLKSSLEESPGEETKRTEYAKAPRPGSRKCVFEAQVLCRGKLGWQYGGPEAEGCRKTDGMP